MTRTVRLMCPSVCHFAYFYNTLDEGKSSLEGRCSVTSRIICSLYRLLSPLCLQVFSHLIFFSVVSSSRHICLTFYIYCLFLPRRNAALLALGKAERDSLTQDTLKFQVIPACCMCERICVIFCVWERASVCVIGVNIDYRETCPPLLSSIFHLCLIFILLSFVFLPSFISIFYLLSSIPTGP